MDVELQTKEEMQGLRNTIAQQKDAIDKMENDISVLKTKVNLAREAEFKERTRAQVWEDAHALVVEKMVDKLC